MPDNARRDLLKKAAALSLGAIASAGAAFSRLGKRCKPGGAKTIRGSLFSRDLNA